MSTIPPKRSWFERLLIRIGQWLDEDREARNQRFEQRLAEDPRRENCVQNVRLMILENEEDTEKAALEIVNYFLPKS